MLRLAFLLLGSHSALSSVLAAELEVFVKDRAGNGVPETVVTVSGARMSTAHTHHSQGEFVVDQQQMRFVPEVLVVPVDSSVNFPNTDSVSHQVYSFSSAKRFQLSLYKGSPHPPVVFDKPGLVVMGCNIHDQMVGYVYVTDAGWYGKTDANGRFTIVDAPSSDVQVTVWNPRIADTSSTLSRAVKLTSGMQSVEFHLGRDLRALPEPRPRNPDWDY